MDADPAKRREDLGVVPVLARHLRSHSEVIRAAAAQALGATGDASAAPVLVDALIDEDPDVRTDAMTALASLARPEDASALRRSLEGDPVGEVKIAAIHGLTRLREPGVLPLLRRLARERCDDMLAWEETGDGWDDWLDVQVAAIEALGRFGAEEAVEDILAACDDELGQDIEETAFDSLAAIPGAGQKALIRCVREAQGRTRRRAVTALAGVAPEQLRALVGLLLEDRDSAVRQLAIAALSPEDEAAGHLACEDPDPQVRLAVLSAFAAARADIVRSCLSDPDETVRAAALRALPAPREPAARDDLIDNIKAWLPTADSDLAIAALDWLVALAGATSLSALAAYVADTGRPLEARVAAVRHIGCFGGPEAVTALKTMLKHEARQVRMAALTALAGRAGTAPPAEADAACDIMVAAVEAKLPTAEAEPSGRSEQTDIPPAADQVRITPDGGIVSATPDEALRLRQTSTLAALQLSGRGEVEPESAVPDQSLAGNSDDDPLHGGDAAVRKPKAGGRHRVSVEGPQDIESDLQLNALKAAQICTHARLAQAVAAAARTSRLETRRAAFEALAAIAEAGALPEEARPALRQGLADDEAVIRVLAARALVHSCDPSSAVEALRPAIDDPDAMVRAWALRAIGQTEPERLVAEMGAREKPLREAALNGLFMSAPQMLARGLDRAIAAGASDIVVRAARDSAEARRHLLRRLAEPEMTADHCLCALRGLAGVIN